MLTSSAQLLKYLPRPVSVSAKSVLVYPRYWSCLMRSRKNFVKYGKRYVNNILFIAGMPKSGTTWLEKMLSSYPGYTEVLIPSASRAENKLRQGHIYELPSGVFDPFKKALVLMKMHCHGSKGNVGKLSESGVPYVVLYRDLRDVAVSHYFYVKKTPWHGDYLAIKNLSLPEGIRYFIDNRLSEFAFWMRSWRDNRDPSMSLLISYEEMLRDTRSVLRGILGLFELRIEEGMLDDIVERNSFNVLKRGELGKSGFFRTGKDGDWVNYFDEDLKRRFKEVDSRILQEFNYELNNQW